MKIARFHIVISESCSYESIYDEQHAKYCDSNTTRISEWVEVTFPPRPAEEIVPAQIAALDAAESELRAKFQQKLQEIAEQRAKLLCLTHEVAA